MKKTKFRFITITALVLMIALTLSLAVSALNPAKRAMAATTYTPDNIFSQGENASVTSEKKEGDNAAYTKFTFSKEEGAVYFRRDLALKWYEAEEIPSEPAEGEEGETENKEDDKKEKLFRGVAKYFSTSFSFPEINFTRFTVKFEGTQENVSKNKLAANCIVFKSEGGVTSAAIKNSSEQDNDDWDGDWKEVAISEKVELTLNEEGCEAGEFSVYVNGTLVGQFTNIGGYYLEYFSSASDTPMVPASFILDKLAEGKSEQVVLMQEFNGQSFAVGSDGKVTDNAAPVLVVNEELHAYTLGKRWELSYKALDVCDASISVSRYYYMAQKTKADEKDEDSELIYKKPTSSNYKSLTTSTIFMPADDTGEEEQYVSIRLQLSDDAGQKSDLGGGYIYLSWYATKNAVKTLGEGENATEYILVNRNEVGPKYVGVVADDESKTNVLSETEVKDLNDIDNDGDTEELLIWAEYQNAVTKAAEGLSAGKGAYFYLPSLRSIIESDYADYRNLTFSVYYYKQNQNTSASATSATSLKYNSLRFEISEIGQYLFCVLATDSLSNSMMYYVDGELVALSSSNIWDIEDIPKFTFSVSYTGAKVEDPGEQSLGYRDSSYSVKSFDIVALSGYETEYKLFYLDEAKMTEAKVEKPFTSYSDLVKNIEKYYDTLKDYLTEIREYNSDIKKTDDAWARTDNDYYWYPDTQKFTPVKTGYYVVELTVTEASLPGHLVNKYQVIDVRNPIDTPPDATYWLENNIVSVVLFSLAAVFGVALVILIVVKPSEKKIDEIDLEKLKKVEGRKAAVMKHNKKKKEESSEEQE